MGATLSLALERRAPPECRRVVFDQLAPVGKHGTRCVPSYDAYEPLALVVSFYKAAGCGFFRDDHPLAFRAHRASNLDSHVVLIGPKEGHWIKQYLLAEDIRRNGVALLGG